MGNERHNIKPHQATDREAKVSVKGGEGTRSTNVKKGFESIR